MSTNKAATKDSRVKRWLLQSYTAGWLGSVLVLNLAAFTGTGCATTSPAQPFNEVRADIHGRTGYQVEWNRFAPGAAAIDTAVNDMLTRELTPETAVQVALLNNRRLQAEYAKLGLAQAELVQAGLLKNPIFQGVLRWAPGTQRQFDFSIVQDFLDILLLPLEVSVAKDELESTKLEVAGRVIDVAADTKRAFYAYVANTQLLELWQSTLIAAQSSYEMAEELRKAGNITEVEVLSHQRTYERAKLKLAHVEANRVMHRERLNRLMGLWGSATTWRAANELPVVPAPQVGSDEIEKHALAVNLQLAREYLQIEVAAKRFQVVEVLQILPAFDLGGTMEMEKEGTSKLVERRRRDGSKYELKEVAGSTEIWSGSEFGVAIPLFDQGQAARAAGRAEIERRYERYTALAIEIRSAAREMAFHAANAQARARFHADIMLPLHETVTQETQLRYNAMFDGVFRLLEAKEQEIDARREYVEALLEYWRAHANIEQLLMGQLPPGFREDGEAGNGGFPNSRGAIFQAGGGELQP